MKEVPEVLDVLFLNILKDTHNFRTCLGDAMKEGEKDMSGLPLLTHPWVKGVIKDR